MNKILTLTGSFLLASSIAFASTANAVSTAKVAELALHRIERLVSLKKIDASFVNKFEKTEVVAVQNQDPVRFKAVVSQNQPVSGKPLQIELTFDEKGKALGFQVIAGGVAGPNISWTGKDPLTLGETAFHAYLEHLDHYPELKPFDTGFVNLTLIQGDLNGELVARALITSTETKDKLVVFQKLNGDLISREVVAE